jgi:hypothetical protein
MGSGLKKDVSENAGQQEGAAFPTEGIGDKSLPSGEDLSLILRASKGIGGSNPAEGRTFNPSRFVGWQLTSAPSCWYVRASFQLWSVALVDASPLIFGAVHGDVGVLH